MDALDIIELIRKRRDTYWEQQIAFSDEPEVLARADFAAKMTEEYNSLLDEIKRVEKAELVQKTELVQILRQQKPEPEQEPEADE